MSAILNLATYRFVSLSDLPLWRERILAHAQAERMRGTVLISSEGINLFVAGEESSARRWFGWLTEQEPFVAMTAKESWSDEIPFNRMLVRLKREIISMGIQEIVPERETSPKLSPDQLKAWLDEGKPMTLLDVRNDYEVEVGTFHNARAIGVDHFRHFPAAVERLPDSLKQEPIVMFCTGGIRCEKAGPLMEKRGFKQIFQLDGGILAYLERHGSAHYSGDCFVFDKRVALDGNLNPSGLAQCYACQAILTADQQASPRYQPGVSCPHCEPGTDEPMGRLLAARAEAVKQVTRVLPGSVPHDNVRPINVPQRLDGATLMQCMVAMHPHMGTDYWEQEFARGRILRGRVAVGGGRKVCGGQRYGHLFPDTIEPDVNADITFVWEDEAIVVVNKPAPLPMHPSGRFNQNTLLGILTKVYAPQVVLRPVHRLDANTTGLVVLAKSKSIATIMQRQFAQGQVEKVYLADCHGDAAADDFSCDAPISRERTATGARLIDPEGDAALTHFRVLRRDRRSTGGATTLLAAMPQTGRTNQIRLHLWAAGLPIVGDGVYLPGGQIGEVQTLPLGAEPLRLHALELAFEHPGSKQMLRLRAPLPQWAGEISENLLGSVCRPTGNRTIDAVES